ncbi:MAG: ABC transporter ATP-binding protein, partial [Gramella sp.]|nr:ABC transporter ATP-binding protein [Christiangramia sp.]
SLVRRPGLLILNEPLDQIDKKEQERIIDHLFDEQNPWSVIVISQDEIWTERCDRHISIKDGQIQNNYRKSC